MYDEYLNYTTQCIEESLCSEDIYDINENNFENNFDDYSEFPF